MNRCIFTKKCSKCSNFHNFRKSITFFGYKSAAGEWSPGRPGEALGGSRAIGVHRIGLGRVRSTGAARGHGPYVGPPMEAISCDKGASDWYGMI